MLFDMQNDREHLSAGASTNINAQAQDNVARFWFYMVVAGFFVLLALTYLMRPIFEPDFFWHLKTGDWIWQHKSLPVVDPFSFSSPQPPAARQLFILQGYWLIQLVYYSVVSAVGIWGVFGLRVLFLATFFWLFLKTFEQQRVNRLLSFSLLALFSIFFLENYALERPQVITFLGIGLLLILYRWVRDRLAADGGIAPALFMVFLLLFVWANMHGGGVLGQGALGVMALVETGQFLRTKNRRRLILMLIFIGVGVVGSLIAPVHFNISGLLSLAGAGTDSFGSSQSQSNYEYYSIYTWLVVNKNFMLLIPVALCISSLFSLKVALQRGSYVEIVLLAIFWIFAFLYVRYLPVAMVFSLLFIAWHYHPRSLLRYAAIPLLAGAVFAMCLWTSNEVNFFAKARRDGLVDPIMMPVKAADFLLESGHAGRIFNTYNWGGYLIWRLSPKVQVATDGRLLNESAYQEMRNCGTSLTDASGRPFWKDVMDKYAINVAVVPLMNGPKASSLAQNFTQDREWQQVFRDKVSAVFARRVPLITQ